MTCPQLPGLVLVGQYKSQGPTIPLYAGSFSQRSETGLVDSVIEVVHCYVKSGSASEDSG